MCRDDNCSRISRNQLDEEADEHVYVRGFDNKQVEDRVTCADMEEEGQCSRSGEVEGNYAPQSCNEGAGEDSGWEDEEEGGDGDRRRAAGV